MKLVRVVLGLMIVLLLSGYALADPTIYAQPSLFPGDVGTAWRTSVGNPPSGYRTFDDFSLTQNYVVTGVTWQGFYRDSVTNGYPVVPNTSTWYIGLFSAPGVVLNDEAASPAAVTATFLGTSTFVPESGNPQPVDVFEFAYTFANPILLNAGATYWFSPFSVSLDSGAILFDWIQGLGGNNYSLQLGVNAPNYDRYDDRAFTLQGGNPVPEPSSLMLLGSGLVAVAGALRRKLRR